MISSRSSSVTSFQHREPKRRNTQPKLRSLNHSFKIRGIRGTRSFSFLIKPLAFLLSTNHRSSTIPNKRGGTSSKFSPPPTFNVGNQVIFFPFLLEKTRYYPKLIRGDGGCVIRLKSQLLLAGIVGPSDFASYLTTRS